MVGLAGRAPGVGSRVGAFVSGPLEEVVLEGVVRCDARLGVIVQHAEDQVFELEVVRHKVAHLARPSTSRSARFHTCRSKNKIE